MSKCRSKKRNGLYFLGVFMLILAFCIPAAAGVAEEDGKYEIYPTPQSIVYENGTTTLTSQVDVTYGEGIDDYTKTRVDDTLKVLNLQKSSTAAAGHTKLIIGIYGSNDPADALKNEMGITTGLFGEENQFDAYSLYVSNGKIVILGEDTDAAYYGVTTLKRIFEQLKGNTIRNLIVKDYADIEFRGFIEGYYGNPWSHEDRMDLMKYGGEIKMNQYIYAPKDDPMHNASWRTLYDKQGIQKVSELAKAGNESKCFFVYALHTFMNNPINFNNYESELEVVKAKFYQVIKEGGVRQIAILEDDAPGTSAANIIRYMNDMNDWLKSLKAEDPELADLKTDILYCPTCYGATTDAKMAAISKGVSSEIHIVVTGGKVWGEISEEFSNNFHDGVEDKTGNNEGTGRYPYMWVNWPCNDNTKNSQIMGGHNYILHTGVQPGSYEGVVLNPIQESESSKVGIFTASDYCWNLWTDAAEGDQAWDDAFKYIDHMTPIETEESLALKEVAKHQIAQSTAQPQVPFEESVELKPMLDEFKTKLNSNTLTVDDTDTLKAEFEKITNAADYYLEHGTNRRMASQMTPFFSCLRDVTKADMHLMDAIKAILEENAEGLISNYLDAQAIYERSKTYGFSYSRDGILFAKAGRKYIEPFTDDMMKYVSESMQQVINPEDTSEKYAITLSEKTAAWTVYGGTEAALTDGDESTFVWYNVNNGDYTDAGDFLEFDLGSVKPVGRIRAVIGADNGDKWTNYHIEYSVDKTKWNELDSYAGGSSGKDIYEVNLGGYKARYIRLVNDVKLKKWVKFSEFSVYSAPSREGVYTNVENAGLETDFQNDQFGIIAKTDIVLETGKYIGLKLDRIHDVENITVAGTSIDGLAVEMSMNGKEWSTETKGSARYIRLMNKGDATVTFDLTSFVVETNEFYPMDFLATSVGGASNKDDARTLGTTKYWMDGDLSTKAKYCSPPTKDGYVTYDLGQEIELRSLRVYVLDTALDYPRDAVIEASLDNENWTDPLITIGDGVADEKEDENTKPVENPGGGWTHDTVDVAYAYAENANINNVKARYIRLRFTAAYAHRWVELNEILINGGEFVPSVNDPTFETNAKQKKGSEISNLTDGNYTSAFKPDGTDEGYLIYNLSDESSIGKFAVLQSGSSISNADVSVRTDSGWEKLGIFDNAYSQFYTEHLENVYAIKLEWKNVVPTFYEIITLEDAGDLLDEIKNNAQKELQAAQDALDALEDDSELKAAETLLAGDIEERIMAARKEMESAATELEKLQAKVKLDDLLTEKAKAEFVVAEAQGLKAEYQAAYAKAQAKLYRVQSLDQDLSEEDRNKLIDDAEDQEKAVLNYRGEAERQNEIANTKKDEWNSAVDEGKKDKQELDKLLENQKKDDPIEDEKDEVKITSFTYGTLTYTVINQSAKTVTVTGPTDKKKVKTVTITATVSYGGITWNVTEISANAFKGCKNLKKVTIGSNVTKIGNSAFASCKKLKTVNMKKAAKITSFGKKSFKGINSKAKITVAKKQLKTYKKKLKKTGLPKTASIK